MTSPRHPASAARLAALALALAVAASGCTGPKGQVSDNPEPAAAGARQVIPQGLVHVGFVDVDAAPAKTFPWRDAAALRDEINRGQVGGEAGHLRWFFHAFDRRHMWFFIGRYEPREPVGGVYRAERQVIVRRSRAAELGLGVAATIAGYERGQVGLRAGMSPEEVEARHGAPQQVIQLGPFGAFDYIYADICVRFLENQASHILARELCVGPE
ncbi:MAG: hypothetical protein KC420_18350 [Myxococcales bacterium]|nr:hypothetical protein [Myxococcales bacterium]